MAKICEMAFAQLSVMLGRKPSKTKIDFFFFFLVKKRFWVYLLGSLCFNVIEDGDEFVPISSGCLLLEEGEMGSDCCLLASS